MALASGQDGARAGVVRRALAFARPVTAALVLGMALSLLALVPAATPWGARGVWACGLGNTATMLANGAPALAYPVPVGVSTTHPIGDFALQYVAGQSITFAEDLSRMPNPPSLGQLRIRWTFGDGGQANSAATPAHTYARPGTYDVHLQIYDTTAGPGIDPWTDLDSAQIQIIASAVPNPPGARIEANRTAIVVGQSITFDAVGSHAPVAGPGTLKYLWNFNDNTTATGQHVTHTFQAPGWGFVALIVTDAQGARSVATINIGIVPNAQQVPTASLSASATSIAAGQPIDFDASRSQPAAQPDGDQITQYVWEFGDGTPTQTTQADAVTHTFTRAGQFLVAVQAVDQQNIPAEATLLVTITAAGGGLAGGGRIGQSWLLIGGAVALALLIGVGGFYVLRTQRREVALARQRAAALELRRARRVPQGVPRAGIRPGDPRWGDPRAGARSGPPRSDPRGARGGPYSGPQGPGGSYGQRDPRGGPPPSGQR
jgi:PKD repeat protein